MEMEAYPTPPSKEWHCKCAVGRSHPPHCSLSGRPAALQLFVSSSSTLRDFSACPKDLLELGVTINAG